MAKIIILSGAGVSAQSGISTFRDSGGLWDEYDVSVICQADSLEKNEKLTIEFYDKRRADLKNKEPNYTHKVITQLKNKYPNDIAVITQNVDNLFEKAGMKRSDIIHLHGFMTEVRCQNDICNKVFEIGYKEQKQFNNGLCSSCGTKLRPNIVFFGEDAPMYEMLNYHIQDCEFFIVIGTSGEVIGVNTIAQFCDKSILNNLEPSSAIDDSLFTKVIYDKSTVAIDEIKKEIDDFL
ncbi:MAG: NAD-dependent deacetylase [Arcobacteraceae bacterium]|nr:NAD-dependent deacetylase [Arcobacteraceae bacterium]